MSWLSDFFGGKKAPKPVAPDFGASYRQGISADLASLPMIRRMEAAAQAGTKFDYTDPATGQTVTADFGGMGDEELSRVRAEIEAATADLSAGKDLELGQKYQNQFIDLALEGVKRSDPQGYEARQELGRRLLADSAGEPAEDPLTALARREMTRRSLDDFSMGRDAAPDQLRNWQQDARGAAVARGNVHGDAPANAEAFNSFVNREGLQQQRLGNLMAAGAQMFGQEQGLRQEKLQNLQRVTSNLSNFALANPISSQFQTLAGAQQGATPNQPVYVGGQGPNRALGGAAANFAGSLYGTAAGIYGQESANNRYRSGYNQFKNAAEMGKTLANLAAGG